MAARRTVSPPTFRRVAWWALATQIGIVVTGAAVRLTGSGLGCTDWPGCTDDRLVPAWGFHHWVEFGNRLLTFVVTAAAVTAVLAARRRRPYRRSLLVLSVVLVAGIVAQALIGAVLVIFELDPRLTILHFATSLVLISAAVGLLHGSAAGTGPTSTGDAPAGDAPVTAGLRRAMALLGATAMIVVGTGTVVTGSGPHGGDERADRFGFALRSVARLHSGAMWLFVAALVVVVLLVRRGGPGSARRRSMVNGLLALTVAQAVLGYVQYALGVPAGLVALHVLGSVLVWALAVALLLEVLVPLRSGPAAGKDGRRSASPARAVLSDR